MTKPSFIYFKQSPGRSIELKALIFLATLFTVFSNVALATDFGMDLDEGIKKEEAFVHKQEVDSSKIKKDGGLKTISIGKGKKANAFDDDFKPIEIPPAQLIQLEDGMSFKKLKDKQDKPPSGGSNAVNAASGGPLTGTVITTTAIVGAVAVALSQDKTKTNSTTTVTQ